MGRKKLSPLPRLIAIEGPLGVGKTTLATHLGERLNARIILESTEANPFLKGFYEDPKRYAFQTQMFFLLSRFQQLRTLSQPDLFSSTTILDYILQKDRIFATLTLEESELQLYDRLYNLLDPRIPAPDLVVYLQARPEVLLERIRSRNHAWERSVTLEYVTRVSSAYNEFFFRYQWRSLLVVNTSDIDIVEKQAHMDEVVSAIRRVEKGVQHYNPFVKARG
jgi:deoxyguanosine kinase